VEVRRIDPDDEAAFEAWYAILRETDLERWPDFGGWSRREAHALTSAGPGAGREGDYRCLAAIDASGVTVGIALCQVPQHDNQEMASLDIRVTRPHRRQGIGTAIATEAERRLAAEGRRVLTCLVEVPVDLVATYPATPFARKMGFVAAQVGNRRHLVLPIAPELHSRLQAEVAPAPVGYRVLTFVAPWPVAYLDDECELYRRMSTDVPAGDLQFEGEVWDASRVEESNRLLADQGVRKLVAVALHEASGHLVAFSELALPQDHPSQAWQWSTLVLEEHRGHRLGLAVKLANLDYLAASVPEVRVVTTGNARENAPMIAVNDMLGFAVVADGTFWQKEGIT
jgi:GNAT superfamily N-acetyltransferase